MGTRGIIAFKFEGKYYSHYNQYDSYPSGLGTEMVNFVKKIVKEDGSQLIPLKRRILKLNIHAEQDTPTQEEMNRNEHFADLRVSRQTLTDWYCLLRNIQGIKTFIKIWKGELIDFVHNSKFILDSLMCEYAYILNLDTSELEFYKGFQTSPQEDNPLGTKALEQKPITETTYYPPALVGKCSINDIPDDWEEKFYGKDDEDEEE